MAKQRVNKVTDYKKYLISPKNIDRTQKKMNHFQSSKPIQDPESVNNSRFSESEHSIPIQGGINPVVNAQKILVFPYKRMMPEKRVEHQFPRYSNGPVLSATKRRITDETSGKLLMASEELEKKYNESGRSNGKSNFNSISV